MKQSLIFILFRIKYLMDNLAAEEHSDKNVETATPLKRDFKGYYNEQRQKLVQARMPLSLDYDMLNSQVNGLAYLSMKELLGPGKETINYEANYDKEKVDYCIQVYCHDLLAAVSVVSNKFQKLLSQVRNRLVYADFQNPGVKASSISKSFFRVMKSVDNMASYRDFNIKIITHLIFKADKAIQSQKVSFIGRIFEKLSEDSIFNRFVTGFDFVDSLMFFKRCAEALRDHGECLTQEQVGIVQEIPAKIEAMIDQVKSERNYLAQEFCRPGFDYKTQFEEKEKEILLTFEERICPKELEEGQPPQLGPVTENLSEKRAALYADFEKDKMLENTHKPPLEFKSINFDAEANPTLEDFNDWLVTEDRDNSLDVSDELYSANSWSSFKPCDDSVYTLKLTPEIPNIKNLREPLIIKDAWILIIRLFIYLLFYYGQITTFWLELKDMEVNSAVMGLIWALTPLSSGVSTYIMVYRPQRAYKTKTIVTLIILMAAIFLQFLGTSKQSLTVLIFARILTGIGENSGTTDTFFTKEINPNQRVLFGYYLTATHALAICIACGISTLGGIITDFNIGSLVVDDKNMGYVLVFVLCIPMLLVLILLFKDPKDLEIAQIGEGLLGAILNQEKESQYEFDLSVVEKCIFLSKANPSLEDDLQEKIKEDQMRIREKMRINKIALAKEYFLSGQVSYIVGYYSFVRAMQEMVLIESPFYLTELKDYDTNWTGFIIFVAALIIVPVSIGHKLLAGRVSNANLVHKYILILLVGVLLKIQYVAKPYPSVLVFIGFILTISFSLGAESCALSILVQLVTERDAQNKFGMGLRRTMVDCFGRIMGCVILTISLAFIQLAKEKYLALFNLINYGFWCLALLRLYWMLGPIRAKLDEAKL